MKLILNYYTHTGSTVEIVNQDKDFVGLFFQDQKMQDTYHQFPELLMIDATYKLTELRMPLFVFLVVDGNGNSEIVAIHLTTEETEAALQKLATIFKRHNEAWIHTKVIITDKDLTERAVFSKEFPTAALQLCLFHTLRTFKREITVEKMGITCGERDLLLELLSKMSYANSESEYNDAYTEFQAANVQPAIDYFEKNWHPIRRQWAAFGRNCEFNLGEATNNRLESINAKIKSVCTKNASLYTFFNEFFALLTVLRNERSHNVIMSRIKKLTPESFPYMSANDMQYAELVTPYAFHLIAGQAKLRDKVIINDGVVCSSEGLINVSQTRCECSFWKTLHLPCRHILAFRKSEQMEYFDVDLVAERWCLNYMHDQKSKKRTAQSVVAMDSISSNNAERKLSSHQKYRKALVVCQELASLASEVGMNLFKERLSVLDKIKQSWIDSDVSGSYCSLLLHKILCTYYLF